MSSQVTPKKNAAFTFYVALTSQADTKLFQVNPTLATGDAKVGIDNGSLNNLATLPVVTPSGSREVLVSLSASEMNGDNIQVQLVDAAGAEWCDLIINIQTTARQIDDLAWPTTTGRSIDVATTGEVGLDFDNIKAASAPTTLTNITVPVVTTLTELSNVIADSIPSDGTRPTYAQALLMLTRFLMERSVVGLTMTVNKENGSTSSMTFTLNDSDNPTSITRAT